MNGKHCIVQKRFPPVCPAANIAYITLVRIMTDRKLKRPTRTGREVKIPRTQVTKD